MFEFKLDWTNIPWYFICSLIIMTIIAVFAIIVGNRVKKMKVGDNPGRIIGTIIAFVSFFNNFIKDNVGKKWTWTSPILLTLAIYIMFANISGLFLLETPTKNTSITLALAITAIFTIQSTGIASRKVKHIKTLFEPIPFLFPINLLGDITPVISMTLRLFGSMASGAALSTLIYSAIGWFAVPFAPLVHLIFDIGFGIIQVLIFVLLTTIFSSNKVEEDDLLTI